MKHLRLFKTNADYESATLELPNVSYVEDTEVVIYTPGSEGPVAPVGASIYGLDGKFYSAEEWTAAGKSNSDAVGVAVSDGEHSFVIHPTAQQENIIWSSNTSVTIDGVFTTMDTATAQGDFAGEANTSAILAAVQAGIIENAPAAQYATSITFANGKTGYLLAAGELELAYDYLSDINGCLDAIDGTTLSLNSKMQTKKYWTSTQQSYFNAWHWSGNKLSVYGSFKYYDTGYCVRVVAAL